MRVESLTMNNCHWCEASAARLAVAVCLALAIGSVCTGHAHGQLWQDNSYAVLYLGDFGNSVSWAWGMNNLGEVVGSSYTAEGHLHAFAWRNGKMQDLGTLGADGSFSRARDVNDLGHIVGVSSTDTQGEKHAFLWQDGIMYDMGTLGYDNCEAWGINNVGQVAGTSAIWIDEDWKSRGFMWEDGEFRILDPLIPSGLSQAFNLNNLGQVIGWSTTDDSRGWAAVIWEADGSTTDMGGGAQTTYPEGINELGQVVGQKNSHAFLWDNGTWYNLEERFGNYDASAASVLNNLTQVVGWIGSTAWTTDACYWDLEHGQVLLGKLLPPKSHWRLRYGNDINDLGQIAGTGNYKNNDWMESQAFLMSPVYPSFDLGLAVPGIAGQVNTIAASNIEPGTKVYFTYSSHSGGTLIPGCDVTKNALQIENAKVAGTASADADGVATLEGMVPGKMSGQWLLFQAVIPGECAISNLVVQKFE
ncbi:MAG: hypothetical protein HND57_11100 [Planctomycetes bacterium]|nr:hypothetical protein [Planctomycetota bacterium]